MGKLISLSGIDGAGKSTQINLIEKYLRDKGLSVYVTESMFGYFLFKPFIQNLRKITKSPTKGPVKRNNNPLYKMWFVFAFVDIWASYFIKIRHLLVKYDVLIADRYYTDLWANILYYGYCPKWAFELLIPFLPKADLSIWLSVEPKNVFKREMEFDKNYYYSQQIIYERFRSLGNYKTVDANGSPEEVLNKIKKLI